MAGMFKGNLSVYHKRTKKYKFSHSSSNSRARQIKRLKATSERLRKNPPASEVWFMTYYQEHLHRKDKLNHVLLSYIPDIHNKEYRYVIEVDGSYHNTPEQILKDSQKDHVLERNGYRVIRVEAYNVESALACIDTVLHLRRNRSVGIR